jgi:hypothetical protein
MPTREELETMSNEELHNLVNDYLEKMSEEERERILKIIDPSHENKLERGA